MQQHMPFCVDVIPSVEVKAVQAKARADWCRDHKHVDETPRVLQDLWHEAFTQINQVRKYFQIRLDDDIDRMPWNMRRAFGQMHVYGSDLFLHVASVMGRGVMVPDNAWSFHAQAVSCCNQGKLSKGWPCGRAFQLGRIGGNVLLVGSCTSLRMEDNAAVGPMIEAHQGLVGQGVWPSFGTDKGYYRRTNKN
jgi:IS5 family transposase